MTTEEKAKKYAAALEDMRVIYPNLRGDAKLAVEHAFPELAESEDEKTRKELLEEMESIPREVGRGDGLCTLCYQRTLKAEG